MAFQIKDFASIVASAVNWMRSTQNKVTDFNVGSVARTMLEAPAIEIEELYLRMFIGLREAIPVAVYNTFGFAPLPAASASGTVRFSTAAPAAASILVPAGTAVRAPGKSLNYRTIGDAIIPIGQSFIDVLAACETPGATGNTGANTLTELVGTVSGVSTVTNTAPIINGRDVESEDDRLTRFRAYISTLSRGTVSAVLYGAKSASLKDSIGQVYEYVALASLEEPWLADDEQPVGLVNVFIHNGAANTSSDLVAEAQKIIEGYYMADGTPIPGWKAAGVKVVVDAATDQSVSVTAAMEIDVGYEAAAVIAEAQAALTFYLQGLTVGASVLRAELISIIKRDVPGVTNVTLTVPATDVAVPISAKAIPGAITLTVP